MNANSSTKNNAGAVLTRAVRRLEAVDISTARLDVLVLLEDLTGQDRGRLLAHPEHELTTMQLATLEKQLARRFKHEPLAYIRGKTEFFGREFAVSPHTLEPRPETETMIELAKPLIKNNLRIADIGTGSGAIGITIALETGAKNIDLIDIDQEALEIARQNCQKYRLKLNVRHGDLLKDYETDYDIVLANLPYVPDGHTINQAAMQEPPHAIFGGTDGLDLYRRMFQQLKGSPAKYVFTESLPFQHADLAKIASQNSYDVVDEADFIQVFTAASGKTKSGLRA